ncbi:uncharacterized protein N7515_001984 [Penicillium bovifimosum]|uniref:Uncharacterized protein n=1 Tax=Penicillium bovifimosum TaxID=126998 RepID=A0A9W9HAQ9_9EURO|nr:uncharacterized protein N7515_001984 [Penicillium bovifimosum]KAJ5143197.1 hypothetical protein N7515_001984 [Penicillium bovifimosum]
MATVTCLAHEPSPTKTYEPVITELQTCDSNPISAISEMPKVKRIDPPAKEPSPQPSRRQSHTSTSTSIHSRSASRSTARSRPDSRRSSFQSARRAPNPAIVPVASARISPQDKRESLIALHRESCRLFQGDAPTAEIRPSLQSAASVSYRSRESRTSSDNRSSAPSSPVASSHSRFRFEAHTPSPPSFRSEIEATTSAPHWLTPRDRANTMPSGNSNHHHSPSSSSMHVPATVMEWTSPDTRRREYEKIDRASSGVRGLWRRVAPRCFQTRDSRVPFFEEGKTQREGSVRRFRMDLPEDDEPVQTSQIQPSEFLRKNTVSDSTDGSRRRWACLRSKTSPA